MNLRDMLDMANSILDYAPGITAYETEVKRFLNEAYLDLFSDRSWSFAQKDLQVSLKADRTASNGNITGATTITTGTNFFEDDMEGMVIQISGSATSSNNKEWRILSVTSATAAVIETKNGTTAGATVDGSGAIVFKVKHRWVALPSDLVQVLSFGIRSPENERQDFGYLNKWLDEHLALDIDLVSRPTDFVMGEDLVIPSPVTTPGVSIVGAGGTTVPAAGTYDICYTFVKYNRESAPSPVSAQATFTAGQRLGFTNLQDTTGTGITKRLYFSNDAFGIKFYQAQSTANDIAEGVTSLGTGITFQNLATWLTASERLQENDGRYRQLRCYPRQDRAYDATLRYSYRPLRLLDHSDAPIIPAEYHSYLVYRTCQELFVKHDNMSQSEVYRKKADDMLLRMEKRYLTESATTWIKGVFRQSAIYRRPRPRLTHN